MIVDGSNYSNGDGQRVGNWMQTFSGNKFWPIDPRASEVFIEDIAHALGNSCRYAGHCERFYSVAEHSVLVSLIVPREHALVGLMHDATEAYVVDVPRPLKPYLTGYKDIEDRVWRAVAERFCLPETLPDCIKIADNAVLLAERDQIMKTPPADWSVGGDPAPVTIVGWDADRAAMFFRRRFRELTGEIPESLTWGNPHGR